jgi:hypothetical protein
VIDHVPGTLPRRQAGRWARMQLLEVMTGASAPVNLGLGRTADRQDARQKQWSQARHRNSSTLSLISRAFSFVVPHTPSPHESLRTGPNAACHSGRTLSWIATLAPPGHHVRYGMSEAITQ